MAVDPHGTFGGASAIRKFTWRVAIVLALLTTIAFVGIYAWTVYLAREGLRAEAESYMELIVTARSWNAMHGGAWVRRVDESSTNEFLRAVGVEPDTSTVSGTMLTLRNPAAMTREISDLTRAGSGTSFRITSLDPVNPANTPDAWEREQLIRFEAGEPAEPLFDSSGPADTYRLMRPLLVRQECLTCHAAQGYEKGDLRGAISVAIPLERADRALLRSASVLAGLWVSVVAALGLVMSALLRRLTSGLERGEAQLRRMAVTDALTGLANRHAVIRRLEEEAARSARNGVPLGVLVVDLDHFKSINDQWGHAAGDVVLREAAFRMRDSVREYDLVGRVGGEEFLVIAPDVDEVRLATLADRLRAAISQTPVPLPDEASITVTASVGGIVSRATEPIEDMMRRADVAMYRAKSEGRDRAVIEGAPD